MQTLLYDGATIRAERRRDTALRQYARWEYGASSATWLLAAALTPKARASMGIGRRLRYWLNSFRGSAALDLRGSERRDSVLEAPPRRAD